ncbi:DDB1- and CUL4-associated factor 8-like protein 2 [Trachymyrmex cornetzi]|uniref:DDB1-and CUL4-associated factor 8-like protein 2 n=1 Tax=Trachymyrmex cornetzi TaxID=471704 RepID=A0A151J1Q3_9HYME|nr:DDB1- and CUL4-associated factor 8-like protein 2 [Trachymyrmex cornetzi]
MFIHRLLVVREDQNRVRLTSIHCNPSNSNEFCVSGHSSYVRVYDRRSVSKPLYQLWSNKYNMDEFLCIETAMYNHNGTEILTLYKSDGILSNKILLFDKSTWSCEGSWKHIYERPRFHGRKHLCVVITVLGINFFGPNSEYIMSGSNCGDIFIYDKNTEDVVQWLSLYDQFMSRRDYEVFYFIHLIKNFFFAVYVA